MHIIAIVFYLCLVIIGVSFAALNASAVTLNLYFKTFTLPIAVFILIAFTGGVLFGMILLLGRNWRLKAKIYKINHQLHLMEREIKNLREIPLKD